MKTKTYLAISILKNKSKIVIFSINKTKNIIIDEVVIITKYIDKSKVEKKIKSIFKFYKITKSIISIHHKFEKKQISILIDKLLVLGVGVCEILTQIYVSYFALSCIEKKRLKKVETNLKSIKNGWLDFGDIEHLDLNGLIHYAIE